MEDSRIFAVVSNS